MHLLDQLRVDHENLDILLKVFERQVGLTDQGDDPDYDLLEAVLQYCLDFAEACHHPKEDLIYDRIAANPGPSSQVSIALHEEHGTLKEQTQHMLTVVEDVISGSVARRDEVVEEAKKFVSAYREHMLMEGRFLFPAARASLTEEDWAQLEQQVPRDVDPLFGENVEARFAVLRQYIQDLDGADRISRSGFPSPVK